MTTRRLPIATLLVGATIAAVLVLLSLRSGSDPVGTEVVAADATASAQPSAQLGALAPPLSNAPTGTAPPPPPSSTAPAPKPTGSGTAAAPAPKVDKHTFAARINGKGATLALAVTGDTAVAYFCDGRSEQWLKGSAKNGKLDLTGKNAATLTGAFTGTGATGSLTVAGKTLPFSLAKVAAPSGLYRATADVRGAKVVGGWIVLPDGTQVGLADVGGRKVTPTAVNTTTGAAVVEGTTVRAEPVG